MKIILVCLFFLALAFADSQHEQKVRKELLDIWTETTNLRETLQKHAQFSRELAKPGTEAQRKRTVPQDYEGPYPSGSVVPTPAGECPKHTGLERAGFNPAEMTGDSDDVRCPVFQSNSCCNKLEAQVLTGLLDISDEDCEHILGDLRCAPCDPDSASFTVVFSSNVSEIVVCVEFCNTLYDRCKDALNKLNGNQRVIAANVSQAEFCSGGEDLRRLANLTSGCYNHIGAAAGKTGCFIATAAYGSDMNPHVWKLRVFRDQYLHGHPLGDKLVDLYYTYSPVVANWIAQHEWARTVTRMLLWPVVTIVETLFV